MYYRSQHTDQELIEIGWSQMLGRLDREMPRQDPSDKWYYLCFSLMLLLVSFFHLKHSHTVGINTSLSEIAIEQPVNNNKINPNTIKGTQLNQDVHVGKSTNPTYKSSDQNQSKMGPTEEESSANPLTPSQSKTRVDRRNETIIQESTSQTMTTTQTRSIAEKKNKKRGAFTNSIEQENLKTKNTYLSILDLEEVIRVPIMLSPVTMSNLSSTNLERSLPTAVLNLPKTRLLTPMLTVGLLRSFSTEATGVLVGFGLRQQLMSDSKLSIKYMLSAQYFPTEILFSTGDNDVLADVESSSIEVTEQEVDMIEQEDQFVYDITNYSKAQYLPYLKNHYQLSASVIGLYQLNHRLSLGIGGKLTYTDIAFSTRLFDDEFINVSSSEEIYKEIQLSGLIQLTAPYQLTRRLVLEPYYQYQVSHSNIRLNQAGLNLTVDLAQ